VRQNVLAFLADLFYILEVRPAKCIRPPGLMRDRFPINEGKKSFGQLSRYVGPFLFLWKKKKTEKNRNKRAGNFIGVVLYTIIIFVRCWWQLVLFLGYFGVLFFWKSSMDFLF
jgi:hypothetical protein